MQKPLPIRALTLLALLLLPLASISARAFDAGGDLLLWLEELESPQSLRWVNAQNARTTGTFEAMPEYGEIKAQVEQLLYAKDRVPFSGFRNGYFYNFWQDANHQHGVIRRTRMEEYRKSEIQWETILDLDALSAAEKENWVYKGAARLDENSNRFLLQLSRGGKDATVTREFDYEKKEFVKDGFFIPEAKTRLSTLSEDEILVATNLNGGEVTTSGYARTVKSLRRGQPLSEARTVFEVKPTDMAATSTLVRDGDKKYVLFVRAIAFYNNEVFLREADGSLRQLPVPSSADMVDIREGMAYVQLKEDLVLGDRTIAANSLLRYPLEDGSLAKAEVIFTANSRQTIEGVTVRANDIYVTLLDNVKNVVLRFRPDARGQWKSVQLPFPDTGVLSFSLKNDRDPTALTMLTYTDALTPSTQYLVHDEDGSFRLEKLKSSPERFDASAFEAKQYFAKSRDGTEVPYFIMKPKAMKLDGSNPTLLYGYGGFENALTPSYNSVNGKAWLERGGVYVIANIRGGGEFGPAWHQAALKEKRQNSYDDFIAVAEDLIARRITSPRHLGIQGGSNGGLLVGTVMVERPDLFNAVLCQAPLLDMARFSKLLAGASWIGEYGNPDNPAELAYLMKYSPFQNVKAGVKYPVPLFTTSTKDDRVHPAHARRMAARMEQQGHPVYFFENVNGGHAGSANYEEYARMTALEYTYLWSRLR